jgi:hypothetical protein
MHSFRTLFSSALLALLATGCWLDGEPGATSRAETPTGVYATPEAAGIDDPAEAEREAAEDPETAGDRFDQALDRSGREAVEGVEAEGVEAEAVENEPAIAE